VFGTVRLQPDNTLSVYVYSDNDTNWTLIGSSESTIGIEFVGLFGYVPGFSAYLISPLSSKGTAIQIIRWKDYGLPGIFRSGTGFSSDIGQFVSICEGVYQISVVLRITNTDAATFDLAMLINGLSTGNKIIHEEERAGSTFPLFISLSLYLKPGDKITLSASGTGSFTIESDSVFSGILINNGNGIPGKFVFILLVKKHTT